ncbi:hypothetical protein ABYF34_06140 [Buchananella felis]|uniref:hypothetical protein n=1 Tax=Buchananella felis TaxID=3231492 RepID=UPI003527C758
MSEQPRLTRRELRARERAAERELRAANDAEAAAAGVAARERLAAQGRGDFTSHGAESGVSAAAGVGVAGTGGVGAKGAAPTETERAIAARAAVLKAAAERAAAERAAAEKAAAERAAATQRAAKPAQADGFGAATSGTESRHAPAGRVVDAAFAPPSEEAAAAPAGGVSTRRTEDTSPIDLSAVAREAERQRRREANLAQSRDEGESTAAFTPSEVAQLNAAVAAAGGPAGQDEGPKVPSRRSLRERRVERELNWESEQDPATRRRVVTSVPRSSGIRTVNSEGHITGVIPVVQVAGADGSDPTAVTALAFPVADNQAPLPPTGALEAVTQAAAAELAGQGGAEGAAQAGSDGDGGVDGVGEAGLGGATPFAPVSLETAGQAAGGLAGAADAAGSPAEVGVAGRPYLDAVPAFPISAEPATEQVADWPLRGEGQAAPLAQAGFGDLVSGAIDPTTDPDQPLLAGADRAFAPVSLGEQGGSSEPEATQGSWTPGAGGAFEAVSAGAEDAAVSGESVQLDDASGAAAGDGAAAEEGDGRNVGHLQETAGGARDQAANDAAAGEPLLGAGERVASPYGAGFTTQEATEQVGDMQNDLRRITGPLPVAEEAAETELEEPKRGMLLWILLGILVAVVVALGVYLGLKHAGVISAYGIEPAMNWNWSFSGS